MSGRTSRAGAESHGKEAGQQQHLTILLLLLLSTVDALHFAALRKTSRIRRGTLSHRQQAAAPGAQAHTCSSSSSSLSSKGSSKRSSRASSSFRMSPLEAMGTLQRWQRGGRPYPRAPRTSGTALARARGPPGRPSWACWPPLRASQPCTSSRCPWTCCCWAGARSTPHTTASTTASTARPSTTRTHTLSREQRQGVVCRSQ